MTQIPAGWYPDPDTSNPGAPQGQRYWDGQQWTEHVVPPAGAPQQPAMPAYTPMAPAGGPYPLLVATTPDGQPLAGWWQRVGAYLIDLLILTPLVVILGWPWIREIGSAYGDLVEKSITAAESGGTLPDQTDLLTELFVPFLLLTLVGLLVNLVYNAGFLKWKAATPGKLAIGLRVRLRETPGPMSWGTVLLRWAGQNWYAAFGFVPVLGSLLGLYPLIDVLWPLWDDKKQALHDKVAKTNVVRHQH
jgi:uncharacterized RDD family membrane protein YckC